MSRKRVKFLLIFLFFVSAVFFNSNTDAEAYIPTKELTPELLRQLLLTPEKIAFYQEEMDAIVQRHRFNGNILLVIGGRVVYETSRGYAEIHNRTPNDMHTIFQLASVSKPFTAMGIAILKERQELSFDDNVIDYIPEFPYEDITIRQLLCHTSGLQNYIWLLDNHWVLPSFPNNEDLVRLFQRHTLPQNFLTGNRYLYSNTGYAFLASVIERVSGKTYAEFLDDNIFKPLQMHDTYVYDKELMDTLSNKALGHVRRGRSYVIYHDDNNDGIVGDKGIYSTVYDLFKWDRALYSDVLVSQQTIAELFQKQTTVNGDTINYGLGWRLPRVPYHNMVYHNGWWHGFRTTFRRYTHEKNTLIILNNTNTNIFSMIREIEDLIFEDHFLADLSTN